MEFHAVHTRSKAGVNQSIDCVDAVLAAG